ncbi:MAG: hypothetical protein K6A74_07890 [Lachnospiraceae bacterium]|nr:hypothetical protein [Lachnospiraceae bacterium]
MLKGKKLNLTKVETAGFIILTCQIILIFIFNLVCSPKYIDCDSAKVMEHIIKMWEHKTLIIDNWYYSTILGYDSVAVFAIPFYGLTKNIFFACSMSNLLSTLIFVYTIFFIFKGKEKVYPLVASCIILLPWDLGMLEYFNMLFFAGAYYIVKVTVPLMFAGLILYVEREDMKKWWKKKDFMLMFILFLFYLLATTASSGVFVLAMGFAPVILVFAIYKLYTWTAPKKEYIVFSILTFISFILGYVVNMNVSASDNTLYGGSTAFGMKYLDGEDLFLNFSNALVGIFEVFGATCTNTGMKPTTYDVMSYEGIVTFFKILFVVFLLFNAFYTISEVLKKKASLLKGLYVSMFFWDWLILIFTNTRAGGVGVFEDRYFLIGMISLIIISTVNLVDFFKSSKIPGRVSAILGVVVILTMIVISYKDTMFLGEQNPNVWAITEYFKDKGFGRVYIYNETNEADKLRLTGNPIHYVDVMTNGKTWVYDFYASYQLGPIYEENACIIVNRNILQCKDKDELFGFKVKKVDEVNDYDIFYFDGQ